MTDVRINEYNKFVAGQFVGQSVRFSLEVVQQPIRSRLCGFGQKDRRSIDPPPVLKVITHKIVNGNEVEMPINEIIPHQLLVQVEIFDSQGLESCAYVYNPSSTTAAANAGQPVQLTDSPTRNLLGSLTAEGLNLKDPEGKPGIFFCFQDLSVRTEGTFRLQFSLMDIDALIDGQEHCSILSQVMSNEFQVYSPKKFPGMTSSTNLSKCFAKQGIKISIRKDEPSNFGGRANTTN